VTGPNVVWVFLDQCRADVLGCYGHPFVRTPNIDRLAASGVLFENAFCQNPVCVPSRASMLSGLYCHQTGVYDNDGRMRPEQSFLLRGFSAAGYTTASIGKVHLGIDPLEAGFHTHAGFEHDGTGHWNVPADYPEDWPWGKFTAPGFAQPVVYATDMCPRERTYCAMGVSAAVAGLEELGGREEPFLLRLSLNRPHTPVTSPKPYDTMYAEQTALPEYSEDERRGQPPVLAEHMRKRHFDRITPAETVHIRSYYYGLVTHLDFELGRLLEAVEGSRQAENTIVLLTVDHGCMLGEHGLYTKRPHYHTETARVPLIISWPGRLPAGMRVEGLVEMVDLLPTLFELCGIAVPQEAAGRSLLPLISGEGEGREDVYAEQYLPDDPLHWHGLRTERYSYWRYTNAGEAMLFDLAEGPAERSNLMAGDSPAEVVEEMEERMAARRSAHPAGAIGQKGVRS
jgi:choline-sulfatase